MAAIEPPAKPLTKTLRKALAAFLVALLLFTNLPANMLEKAGVNTSFLPDSVAYATPADAAECDFAATYGLGDTLRLADGSTGVVGSVFDETLDAPVKVYNFEVEGLHTYYVGGSVQVLVHNTCGGQPPAPSHVGGGAPKSNYREKVPSPGGGAPPASFTPEGASRSGAFNEAKRASGIPVSESPASVAPARNEVGQLIPGRHYEFTDGKVIRDEFVHLYPDNPTQNRGPHFHDTHGNHYDY